MAVQESDTQESAQNGREKLTLHVSKMRNGKWQIQLFGIPPVGYEGSFKPLLDWGTAATGTGHQLVQAGTVGMVESRIVDHFWQATYAAVEMLGEFKRKMGA